MKKMKKGKTIVFTSAIMLIMIAYAYGGINFSDIIRAGSAPDRSPSWYNQDWMTNSQFSPEFELLDTESALGRYCTMTKRITMKDLIKFHGHACDGLIMAAGALKLGLDELFPEGFADRTDLRIVCKNSPCFVDVAAYLTGGRINFGTLEIDNSLQINWIVQRISTGKTVKAGIRDGVFPKKLAELEKIIRGGKGTSEDITICRTMAWNFAKTLVSRPLEDTFKVEIIKDFSFPKSAYAKVGKRGDIVHKNDP